MSHRHQACVTGTSSLSEVQAGEHNYEESLSSATQPQSNETQVDASIGCSNTEDSIQPCLTLSMNSVFKDSVKDARRSQLHQLVVVLRQNLVELARRVRKLPSVLPQSHSGSRLQIDNTKRLIGLFDLVDSEKSSINIGDSTNSDTDFEKHTLRVAHNQATLERNTYMIHCCHVIARFIESAGHEACAAAMSLFPTSRDLVALVSFICSNPEVLLEFVDLLRLLQKPKGFDSSSNPPPNVKELPKKTVSVGATDSPLHAVANALDVGIFEVDGIVAQEDKSLTLRRMVNMLPSIFLPKLFIEPHGPVQLPFSVKPNDPTGPMEFRIPKLQEEYENSGILELESAWISPANPVFLRWLALKQVQMAVETLGFHHLAPSHNTSAMSESSQKGSSSARYDLSQAIKGLFFRSDQTAAYRTTSENSSDLKSDSRLLFPVFRPSDCPKDLFPVLKLWQQSQIDLKGKWGKAYDLPDDQIESEVIAKLCSFRGCKESQRIDSDARALFSKVSDTIERQDDISIPHGSDSSAVLSAETEKSTIDSPSRETRVYGSYIISGLLYDNSLAFITQGVQECDIDGKSAAAHDLESISEQIVHFVTPGPHIRFRAAFMASFRSSISALELLHTLIYLYLHPSKGLYLNKHWSVLKLQALQPRVNNSVNSHSETLTYSLTAIYRAQIMSILLSWTGCEYGEEWTSAMLILATRFLEILPKDDAFTQAFALSLLRLRQYHDSQCMLLQDALRLRQREIDSLKERLLEEERNENLSMQNTLVLTRAHLKELPQNDPSRCDILQLISTLEAKNLEEYSMDEPFGRSSLAFLVSMTAQNAAATPGVSLGSMISVNVLGADVTSHPTTFFRTEPSLPIPIQVEPSSSRSISRQTNSTADSERHLPVDSPSGDSSSPKIPAVGSYSPSSAPRTGLEYGVSHNFSHREQTSAANFPRRLVDQTCSSIEYEADQAIARVTASVLNLLKHKQCDSSTSEVAYGANSISAATALVGSPLSESADIGNLLVSAHGAPITIPCLPGLIFSGHPFSPPSFVEISKLALTISRRTLCQLQSALEGFAPEQMGSLFIDEINSSSEDKQSKDGENIWMLPSSIYLAMPGGSLYKPVLTSFNRARTATDSFNTFLTQTMRTNFVPLPHPPAPHLNDRQKVDDLKSNYVHPSMRLGPRIVPPLPSLPLLALTQTPIDCFKDWTDPQIIAEQLTYLSYSLFCTLTPMDIMRSRCQPVDPFNRMALIIRHFNQTSYWTATEVLAHDHPQRRVSLCAFFLDVATDCITRLHNFHTAFAIGSALALQPIFRLKGFKFHLSEEHTHKLNILMQLVSGADNYAGYRALIEKAHTGRKPAIPYMAVLLKDLMMISEPSRSETLSGCIKSSRFMDISSELMRVLSFQQTPYRFCSGGLSGRGQVLHNSSRRSSGCVVADKLELNTPSIGSKIMQSHGSEAITAPLLTNPLVSKFGTARSPQDLLVPVHSLDSKVRIVRSESESSLSTMSFSEYKHTRKLEMSTEKQEVQFCDSISPQSVFSVLSKTRFGIPPPLPPTAHVGVSYPFEVVSGEIGDPDLQGLYDEDYDDDDSSDSDMSQPEECVNPIDAYIVQDNYFSNSVVDRDDITVTPCNAQTPPLPPLPDLVACSSNFELAEIGGQSLISKLTFPYPSMDLRLPAPTSDAEQLYVCMFSPNWPTLKSSLLATMKTITDHTIAHVAYGYLTTCAELLDHWVENSKKLSDSKRFFRAPHVPKNAIYFAKASSYEVVNPRLSPMAMSFIRKMASSTLNLDPNPITYYLRLPQLTKCQSLTARVLQQSHLYLWQVNQLSRARKMIQELLQSSKQSDSKREASHVPSIVATVVSTGDTLKTQDIIVANNIEDEERQSPPLIISSPGSFQHPPSRRRSGTLRSGDLPQVRYDSPALTLFDRSPQTRYYKADVDSQDHEEIPSLRLYPHLLREIMGRMAVAIGHEELQQKSLEVEPKMTDSDYLERIFLTTLIEEGSV